MTSKINMLIEDASHDMFNPVLNFNIAKEYESLSQTASAVSFYLRAAEYGYESEPLIVYSSLLRMSICFEDQKDRNLTVNNAVLQAIAHMPNRPEAYFLLARFHERSGNWQECYAMAEVGLMFSRLRLEPLPIDVEYPGEYGLHFEKALSAWWIGRDKESVSAFNRLLEDPSVSDFYKQTIKDNLDRMKK